MKLLNQSARAMAALLLFWGMLAAVTAVPLFAQSSAGKVPQGKDVLARVNAALQNGEADHALEMLNSLSRSGEDQAEARNLECRVYYMLEQWDRAVDQCSQAVRMSQGDSDYHMWLARALGGKADKASFISAYSLAKRTRAEFEEAVRLNPRNVEAQADLAEFYYSAPGVVGGGTDKAEGVAAQLEKIDPACAHDVRGRIAEQRKDYSTAEREFKLEITAGDHPASGWITLAGFYRRRGRLNDMEPAVRNGVNAAPRDKRGGIALFDGASVLMRSNRNFALAVKMLETYLAGSVKSEEAPAFVAHLRLAQLKGQLGDTAGAQKERAAAQAMAHEYKPAQDAKH
jgi:tetratricopeptide (TPR) repeat protein